MTRSRLCVCLFLLLALVPAAAGPDDEDAAAREYARKMLVAQARRVIGPGTVRPADLIAMRRTLTDDINFLTSIEATDDAARELLDLFQLTIEERILLLGNPLGNEATPTAGTEEWLGADPGSGDALRGAAGEAVRLLRWLRGEAECGVEIDTLHGDVVVGDPRSYRYDPHAPGQKEAAPAQAPAKTESAEANPAPAPAPAGKDERRGGEAPSATPKEGEPAPAEATTTATTTTKDAEAAPDTPEPPKTTEPAPPLTPMEWARNVILAKEGTLLDKRLRPAACTEVGRLIELGERPVAYLKAYGRPLRRHVLATPDPFAYNVPFVRLREVQALERQRAIGEERTPGGLVDESLAREKVRRAAYFREVADKLRAERDRLLALQDQMVLDMLDWREQAAVLSGRIQKEKRRLNEAHPAEQAESEADARPATSLALRVMEAQEAVITLDLRMFFHTVIRSDYRLELLRDYLTVAEMVAQAAEAKREEFSRALDQVRNERQIDRLRSEAHLMQRAIGFEEQRKDDSSERPALRIAAYKAVIEVNGIVREAVARRRIASAPRLAQETEDDPAQAPTPAPAASKGADPTAAAAAAGAASLADSDPRRKLSAIARRPSLHVWSLGTIFSLANELSDPSLRDAYDATLIAEHYDAATVQVDALKRALEKTGSDAEITARFEAAYGKAEAALVPLDAMQDYVGTTRLRNALTSLRTDFERSLTAVAERRKEHQAHLDALRAYQSSLLDLGSLSLAIRTNTDLDAAELARAGADTLKGIRQTGHFFDPSNERGLLGFAAKHWGAALAALAVLAGVLMGVRALRRWMDDWLDREAATIPHLRWTGASVREERRHAVERKKREDEAARAAAEQARIRASAPPEVTSDVDEGGRDAEASADETADTKAGDGARPKEEGVEEADEAKPRAPSAAARPAPAQEVDR